MGSSIRVLYVDDEPGLLDICKQFLELSTDMCVDTVISPREALDMMCQNEYNVIISDQQMPGMSGIEFLKQLRSSGNNVPFILFTGKGREEVVIEAYNSGASFYFRRVGTPRPSTWSWATRSDMRWPAAGRKRPCARASRGSAAFSTTLTTL